MRLAIDLSGFRLALITHHLIIRLHIAASFVAGGRRCPVVPGRTAAPIAGPPLDWPGSNALVEEVIYRGRMQPAFVQAAGIARGLWIQAVMFGLLHWGMSVGVVAALPTSLMIGIGAVFWGKAVLDTRGLSWVIIAHAMVDVAIMSAYFVPRAD